MIGFRFGEEPVSYCYGVAGVTAPATETVSILYHVIVMKSRFLPVYIPQAKAWGFDGGVLKDTTCLLSCRVGSAVFKS